LTPPAQHHDLRRPRVGGAGHDHQETVVARVLGGSLLLQPLAAFVALPNFSGSAAAAPPTWRRLTASRVAHTPRRRRRRRPPHTSQDAVVFGGRWGGQVLGAALVRGVVVVGAAGELTAPDGVNGGAPAAPVEKLTAASHSPGRCQFWQALWAAADAAGSSAGCGRRAKWCIGGFA